MLPLLAIIADLAELQAAARIIRMANRISHLRDTIQDLTNKPPATTEDQEPPIIDFFKGSTFPSSEFKRVQRLYIYRYISAEWLLWNKMDNTGGMSLPTLLHITQGVLFSPSVRLKLGSSEEFGHLVLNLIIQAIAQSSNGPMLSPKKLRIAPSKISYDMIPMQPQPSADAAISKMMHEEGLDDEAFAGCVRVLKKVADDPAYMRSIKKLLSVAYPISSLFSYRLAFVLSQDYSTVQRASLRDGLALINSYPYNSLSMISAEVAVPDRKYSPIAAFNRLSSDAFIEQQRNDNDQPSDRGIYSKGRKQRGTK